MYDEAYQSRIRTICLMVMASVVVAFSIFALRPVLLPFVVAVFVVSGIAPVLQALERRLGVSRLVAAGITFLLGLFVLVLLGGALWASVLELADNAPAYRNRVKELITNVEGWLPTSTPVGSVTAIPTSESNGQTKVRGFLDNLVQDGIGKVSQALINLVSTSVVVLIYVFFLLLGAPVSATPSPTFREIDQQIRSYLSLKTSISVATGVAFGVALYVFGVPMALTFGVLAFLLNYIPNVGPIVASLLPIPLILLHPDASIFWMLSVICVTSGIQIVSGNVVEPKLMGDSSDLHPVVILLALMFWGMLWGIVGMFLATPMTAAMKIILARTQATKPIAEVMAGRWREVLAAHSQVAATS